jgi:hypothetical protein
MSQIQARPTLVGVDTTKPNVARMWDYQLGGKDNFAADRLAADALNEACAKVGAPDGRVVARENRAFIDRAVRFLAGPAGIDQFIDLGAGLPTLGNVHQIGQRINPAVVTAYIDNDPLVLVHGRALLADNQQTTVIQADLRNPEQMLDHPDLHTSVDLTRPVAIMLVAVLHLVPDRDAFAIVAKLRDAMVPGSYLSITHAAGDVRPDLAAALAAEFSRLDVSTPFIPRDREAVRGFFEGLDLVRPGLVFPTLWRPNNPRSATPGSQWMYAGIGRKPASVTRQTSIATTSITAETPA